jgi:hypothetical protein
MTSGAREKRVRSFSSRISGRSPSSSTASAGEPVADLAAGVAAIEDEAPGREPSVIGHARRDPDHQFDLVIVGPGSRIWSIGADFRASRKSITAWFKI